VLIRLPYLELPLSGVPYMHFAPCGGNTIYLFSRYGC
jgi:hypothetical protein